MKNQQNNNVIYLYRVEYIEQTKQEDVFYWRPDF
jgi:hypothetical protein